jgi:hypothetical protein
VESGELLLATLASRTGAAVLAEALEKARTFPRRSARQAAQIPRCPLRPGRAPGPAARIPVERSRLRVCSNALWLSLFGGLGVAVFTGSMLVLLAPPALSLLLWPMNSVVFYLTVRKLAWWLPRAHGPDLSKRLVAMLSPISGVRGVDMLAREVWANLDPMTVAAALLSPRICEIRAPVLGGHASARQ